MIIWIYQSLITFILFLFNDINTMSAEGKVNVLLLLGHVGANRTEIECLYNYSKVYVFKIDAVSIMAFSSSSKMFESIASFRPDETASLTPKGQYLRGRVTLKKITNSSTEAIMIFNQLLCIDDTLYRCNVRYTINGSYDGNDTNSNNISLQVQVPPSKQDKICWKKVSIDSSMNTNVFNHSTFPTTDYYTTTSINSDEELSINTSYRTTPTFPTYDNHTTSSTNSHEDLSINTSYRTTTYSSLRTTTTQGIVEGDTIIVVCTGNVGNPPVEHVFQKYLNGKIVPIQDSVNKTSIPNMPDNCSYYRTSNITFKVTAADNNSVIRCVINSSMADPDMYIETTPIQVNSENSTNPSNNTGSCPDNEDKKEKSDENPDLYTIISLVLSVVIVIIITFSIVMIARKKRKSKSPTIKNESKSFVEYKQKQVTESRFDDYDFIALEDDATKKQSVNNGLEVEDNKKHNKEYLKKQEEEEQNKNESNTPPQPAVYAQVNEATKSRNKQNTETRESSDKQEEDAIYDIAGDRRHKENENVEHFDSSYSSSKHNSNGDNKLSIQTSKVGSYANQAFEKDENRTVATVSPTIRSSSGSQNDEQTNLSRNSQSKKGYENIISTDQTGTSEEDSFHRTAL